MGGTEGRSGSFGEQTDLFPLPGIEPPFLGHSFRNPFTTTTLLQRLQCAEKAVNVLKSQMTETYRGWGSRRCETKQKLPTIEKLNKRNTANQALRKNVLECDDDRKWPRWWWSWWCYIMGLHLFADHKTQYICQAHAHTHTLLSPTYMVERIMF